MPRAKATAQGLQGAETSFPRSHTSGEMKAPSKGATARGLIWEHCRRRLASKSFRVRSSAFTDSQPQNCRSQIQKGQELLWPPGLSGAVPQEKLTTPLPSLPHWLPTQTGKFLLCVLKSVSLMSTSTVGTHLRWDWLLREDLTHRSQTTQITCRLSFLA